MKRRTVFGTLPQCSIFTLEYTFGGMMSNTQMVEQLHGMLRWYLQDNQSIEYTDMVHGYRMRQGHDMQEERRDAKNSTSTCTSTATYAAGGNGNKRRKTDASKTKPDACMQSRQLLDSCAKYKGKARGATGVKKIGQRGFLRKDTKIAEEKMQMHKKKRAARSIADDKDASYYGEIAKKLKLDNDVCWISNEVARERELTAKVSAKGFWEREVPNRMGFHLKLLRVFPELPPAHRTVLQSAISHPLYPTSILRDTPTRANILDKIIIPHTKEISGICKRVMEYLTKEEAMKCEPEDIAQIWIKWGRVGPTKDSRKTSVDVPRQSTKAIKTVLKTNGTDASTHYTYDKKYAKFFEEVEFELEDLAATLGVDPENSS
mmetsp:Transcript_18726/g.40764  ORF Transcript_18726/g.40764 Transcript_18726/m.40764 type:complete len:375 (-) Transcript_18726:14-1138(-)